MTTLSGPLVSVNNLIPGSLLDIETKSRTYHLEYLGGNKIRISGHPDYCPQPVPAQLQGSIDKEGELEFGMIGKGMRLMVVLNDQRRVMTSKISNIRVERPQPSPSKAN